MSPFLRMRRPGPTKAAAFRVKSWPPSLSRRKDCCLVLPVCLFCHIRLGLGYLEFWLQARIQPAVLQNSSGGISPALLDPKKQTARWETQPKHSGTHLPGHNFHRCFLLVASLKVHVICRSQAHRASAGMLLSLWSPP